MSLAFELLLFFHNNGRLVRYTFLKISRNSHVVTKTTLEVFWRGDCGLLRSPFGVLLGDVDPSERGREGSHRHGEKGRDEIETAKVLSQQTNKHLDRRDFGVADDFLHTLRVI